MVVVDLPACHTSDKLVHFYLDDRLRRQLDKIKLRVNTKDNDYFWAVDGEEGSGKSTFVFQLAKYVDPTFDLSRIVFTAKDFQSVIVRAKKGQAIVFDEAFRGLSSRSSLNEVNKMLIGLMMECRQKNLFVFVVMPTFFLLDKYVALWRAQGLFHVYKRKESRGFWVYFNKKKKKLLYLKGHATYDYRQPRSSFRGKFFNQYTVDEDDYRKKKSLAFNSGVKILRADELLTNRNVLLWYLNRKLGLSTYEISEEMRKLGWRIKHNTICEIIVKKDRDLGMIPE